MKLHAVLVASAFLAVASPAAAGGRQAKLPDLVITQFGLQSWGTCAPGKTMFTFLVRVKNQGTASWVGNTEVRVADLKNSGWFSDLGTAPIAPGQSRNVPIAIDYLDQNPGFMASASPHPFQATVNLDLPHQAPESNYANNQGPGPAVWMGKKVIMVATTCGRRR